MSQNQSRAEKSEGHLRKSGGRSGHGRGFSGGGGGGKGGGGGVAAHPHQFPSTSSGNRSFKKSGNGQGGQSRLNPGSIASETYAATTIPRHLQNGAHGQPIQSPSQVSTASMANGPKPGDTPMPRTSRPLPKAPMSQSTARIPVSAAPCTPVKGDGAKPFPLQFGTFSPGTMNGLQIPARTSSAPPNLDEQKRDQARHDSFRAIPTQPIPPGPKQQRLVKDVVGASQSTSGEPHPPFTVKKDVHQVSTAPVALPSTSSAQPFPSKSMAMPFQPPPMSVQFGGPGSHQMPMNLPIGNAPQVQQQMFIHGLQSHPLPPQAMIHQGQSLGFGISHPMGQQFGSLGIGIAAPQYTQQQQQQGKFGGPRKSSVKITHPETHEELRLDKRTDAYNDGVSSGQRPHTNVNPQSQPIGSFSPSPYFPQLQQNSYNPSPVFISTSMSSVTAGSQPPRFTYPVGQSGQAISFTNPSLISIPDSKSVHHLHVPSEPTKLEHSVSTAPSGQTVGSTKPAVVSVGSRVVGSSVTITMPVNKVGELKSLKPPGETSVIHSYRDSESSRENCFMQPETIPQSPGVTPGESPVATTSIVSTQTELDGTKSAPSIPSEASESVVLATDGKIREPVSRSDSLEDHQKKTSKKELGLSKIQQQTDESASLIASKLCSEKIPKDGNLKECTASTKARTGEAVETKVIPSMSGSSGVITEREALQVVQLTCPHASSSCPEIDESVSKDLGGNVSLEVECRIKASEESGHGESEVSEASVLDGSNVKICHVPTTSETFEDLKPLIPVKYEDIGRNNSENLANSANAEATHENTCSLDVDSTIPCSQRGAASVEALTSERTGRLEACPVEVSNNSQDSTMMSVSKDKLLSESMKAKPNAGKKKKRREILSKADAAGTSDLYNAYKGPEKESQLAISESLDSSLTGDEEKYALDNLDTNGVTIEEDEQSIAEVDDWEDAADVSTPKLENEKQIIEANKHSNIDESEAIGTKKYSRDFLLTFSEQCTELPLNFEIGSDIANALMSVPVGSAHVVSRDAYPSPGRASDRSVGISRNDRRGIGVMDDDRWTKLPSFPLRMDLAQNFHSGQGVPHGVLRNPRGQPSNQFIPILSGHMQSQMHQGGSVRNTSDSDRWRSLNNLRGLMPPPQMPLQIMHKAERKYEVGKVSDEEQAKQRQLKGILNKLTPQNFEKLFQQVKDVNIDNTVTLTGVISQIFDKALMEPTFCEMYADFCFCLSGVLPDFTENGEKITFKRLLLNKCQEEFERGEREQAEADRADEEGEIKLSKEEREEKRIKVRRRMLGNIRLIGELYKKKMLTERIMHECIQKLLGEYQNPDEEDLEALCKLMSTIGDQIDHAKAKEHMDLYFDMILKLSTNQKLSSRVRFMLRDVIDLRKNRWQQRRKVEGPKKIEEVHRDAAQERQTQTSRLTRGPGMNSASRRAPPGDYGPRGSSVLPSPNSQIGGSRGLSTQVRGYAVQDVRLEDRHPLENRTLPFPLTQRHIDDSSITLGPQGGLARGMSIRGQPLVSAVPLTETLGIGDDRKMTSGPNSYSYTPDRVSYNSKEDAAFRYIPNRSSEIPFDQPSIQDQNVNASNRDSRGTDRSFDRFGPVNVRSGLTQGPFVGGLRMDSNVKLLSEEALREKSISAIKEFYSAKDEKEVALCIKELNSPSFYPSMVSLWVTDSFERKDKERDLLATLLVNLCKSHESVLSQVQLTRGFESVLSSLEDAVNDAPRAAEFLGRIFVKVILENVISLSDIGKLIYEGGEEPGRLLETGLASEVLGSILENINVERGEPVLQGILTSSKLRLGDFMPPHPIKSRKLDAFL